MRGRAQRIVFSFSLPLFERRPGAAWLESPGFIAGFDGVAVMGAPIQSCCREMDIAKYVRLLGEVQIRGNELCAQ